MPTTTLSSREFNQDRARAKRAAKLGPVVVTERGKPELVLMSYAEYERQFKRKPSLAELLAYPDIADIELDIPPRTVELHREIDLD
jgi:prevent-host-death family protein